MGINSKQHQLCENCQKAACALGGCNWSNHLKPVEGWKAIPTKVKTSEDKQESSFLVLWCPEFVADPPRRENKAMLSESQDEEFKRDPLYFLKRYDHHYKPISKAV